MGADKRKKSEFTGSREDVVERIREYTEDKEDALHARLAEDTNAMIRTLDEIRALPETAERS